MIYSKASNQSSEGSQFCTIVLAGSSQGLNIPAGAQEFTIVLDAYCLELPADMVGQFPDETADFFPLTYLGRDDDLGSLLELSRLADILDSLATQLAVFQVNNNLTIEELEVALNIGDLSQFRDRINFLTNPNMPLPTPMPFTLSPPSVSGLNFDWIVEADCVVNNGIVKFKGINQNDVDLEVTGSLVVQPTDGEPLTLSAMPASSICPVGGICGPEENLNNIFPENSFEGEISGQLEFYLQGQLVGQNQFSQFTTCRTNDQKYSSTH